MRKLGDFGMNLF